MDNKQAIFTSKKFVAEVRSASVTGSGLALKLIIPKTEMNGIIPSISECIGAIVDFEFTIPQGDMLQVVEWKNQDQTELNLDPQINKSKKQEDEDK